MMAKRFYCLVLSVLMLLSLVPATALAAETAELPEVTEISTPTELTAPVLGADDIATGSFGDNVSFSLNKTTGKMTISGTGPMEDLTEQTAYWIDLSGNDYRKYVKSIVIEDGVTSIGDYVFNNYSSLVDIALSKSVISIGKYAFESCSNLAQIYIPDNSVTTIKDYAFCSCEGLTNITIPEGVTTIGMGIFENCTHLASINIPSSAVTLSQGAFAYCDGLENITVNANNPYYCSSNGVLFSKDKTTLVQYPSGNMRTIYVIPNGVTAIGNQAFYLCKKLSSVSIPNGVTSIGESAFGACWSLKSVNIPDSVEFIGEAAFYDCLHLVNITIPCCTLDEAVFYGCQNLVSITIPKGIATISTGMFMCCGITSVTIPNSVTSIEDDAFFLCDNLNCIYYTGSEAQWNSIVVGNNNESLSNATKYYNYDPDNPAIGGKCGENVTWTLDDTGTLTISGTGEMRDYGGVWGGYSTAPWFWEKVTSVVIEDGVTNVGDFAFYGCSDLQSVTLPQSVTAIQYAAFSQCARLNSVTLPENLQSIGECAFSMCDNLKTVNLPQSVTDIQYFAFGFCRGLSSISLPEGLKSIGDAAFRECRSLVSVSIPRSVTEIQYKAFMFCVSLQNLSLPDTLQSIDEYAFYGCLSLSSCSLPSSVKAIKDYAFCGSNLRGTLMLPSSLTMLSPSAFSGTELTSVSIPAGLKNVDLTAFSNYSSLSSFTVAADSPYYSAKNGVLFNKDQTVLVCYPVGKSNSLYTVPDSVTVIGQEAFYGNSYLHRVSLPDGLTDLGNGAFSACMNLESISVPGSVGTVGSAAFSCCHALQKVTLREGITEIGADAFFCCENLQSITIPSTVKTIQDWAFGSSGLTSLTLPEGVEAIGSYAFADCRQLTGVSLPQSLEYIDENAFAWCDDLTATYPNTKATWDSKVYVSGNNKPLLDVLHFSDSLTVTGLTAAHNGMTIQLRGQGSGEVLASTTVKNGAYGVINLPDGVYTLSLSRFGCVPFDTTVTVADHALALGSVPTLVKKGDVNGAPGADGKAVDVSDMQCLYDYLATGTLTGQITNAAYFAAVADFNEDGAVNILDYQAIYERVQGGGNKSAKIGVVLIGDENEAYSYAHIAGIRKAMESCGLTNDNLVWFYSVPESEECYDKCIACIEEGCGLVITNSYGHQAFAQLAASENPDVQFVNLTGDTAMRSELSNFHNAYANVFESRYVSGIVAGMKLKEMLDEGLVTDPYIGYVGAFPYAEVISGYTAFFLGIKSIVADAHMDVQYTQSWFDLTKEAEAANALMARGCVLIGQHADSTGAPSAVEAALAEGKVAYSVGYNIDMLSVAPNAALTSATIDWSVYFAYLFDALLSGEDIATDWSGGYAQDAVGITALGPNVAPGTAEAVANVEKAIKSDMLHVFDTTTFTVGGEEVTTCLTFDSDGDWVNDTNEGIADGYYHESEYISAPSFALRIDGISELA